MANVLERVSWRWRRRERAAIVTLRSISLAHAATISGALLGPFVVASVDGLQLDDRRRVQVFTGALMDSTAAWPPPPSAARCLALSWLPLSMGCSLTTTAVSRSSLVPR